MHNCPRCGQPTEGAWSEGGIRWAICEDCMSRERERAREESSGEDSLEPDSDPPIVP